MTWSLNVSPEAKGLIHTGISIIFLLSFLLTTGVDIKAEFYRDLYFERYRDLPHPTYQRRGSLQLWQFLVALLDDPAANSAFIAWTGRGLEFKLIEPEEVTTFKK